MSVRQDDMAVDIQIIKWLVSSNKLLCLFGGYLCTHYPPNGWGCVILTRLFNSALINYCRQVSIIFPM